MGAHKFTRRHFLGATAAALSAPAFIGRARAAAPALRVAFGKDRYKMDAKVCLLFTPSASSTLEFRRA